MWVPSIVPAMFGRSEKGVKIAMEAAVSVVVAKTKT